MVDPAAALAEIKRRHEAMKAAMLRENCALFTLQDGVRPEQIGLHPVMCDELGRLWDVSRNPIRRIYPPPNPKKD